MQTQETAAFVQQSRGASDRDHAPENAATEQLRAQVAALQDTVCALQACVAARDTELDRVNESLRVAQRDLDQAIRASSSDLRVRS